MSKITLTPLANLQNETTAVTAINNNSAAITAAIENTLSRDGTTPNTMSAPLDMNSNHILNLPAPIGATDPVRLEDLTAINGVITINAIPPGGTTNQVLKKTSNADYVVGWGNSVSSVGLALPADFTVTNSPVTSSGTLTGAWVNTPTGTGGVVRATSPTITTPTITTPTISTPTITGHPTVEGITSTGATGTGKFVFDTTPTLVTPILGVATGTSFNKMLITAPATTSTLAVANNKTFTANNTLTLAGTDSTTITFQGTDTYVGKATTDTLTNKTFDTAGTGNSFSINGVAATANTGTGSVVRATSPTLVTPTLGAATATTINGAALDNLAWTVYSPALSAQGGTIANGVSGAAYTTTGRYKQIGKTVIAQMDIQIATIGSGVPAGSAQVTLPFTAAAFRYVGSVFEYTATGRSGSGFVAPSGTFIATRDAAGTTWFTNGFTFAITVTYEVP